MTGKSQPRFRLSADEDAPNVIQFIPAAEWGTMPVPVPEMPEEEWTPLHDIRAKLNPSKFYAPVTHMMSEPAVNLSPFVGGIKKILEDALRLSENNEPVEISFSQWALLQDMFEGLFQTTANMMDGGVGLEWSAALNGMLLSYALEHCPADVAADIRSTVEKLTDDFERFANTEISNEGN